jgi:hypothetical protein
MTIRAVSRLLIATRTENPPITYRKIVDLCRLQCPDRIEGAKFMLDMADKQLLQQGFPYEAKKCFEFAERLDPKNPDCLALQEIVARTLAGASNGF